MNLVIAAFFHLGSNYLLLLGTDKLTETNSSALRLGLASALGAGISLTAMKFRFPSGILFAEIISISSIAFGKPSKRWCVFSLLRLALVGAGQGSAVSTILSTLLVLILTVLSFSSITNLIDITVKGNCTLELKALRDTGNTLRDPISGESVLVVSPYAARKLTGLSQNQLENPLRTLAEQGGKGLRVIPYHSVGQSGFLLAKRFPVQIGKEEKTAVVAFAPCGMENCSFQALTGGHL